MLHGEEPSLGSPPVGAAGTEQLWFSRQMFPQGGIQHCVCSDGYSTGDCWLPTGGLVTLEQQLLLFASLGS